MTREKHLKFCTVCHHKQFDAQLGIICSLTGRQADFEGSCSTFVPIPGAETVADTTPYDYKAVVMDVESRMASTGKRFANYFIDTCIVYLLIFIAAFSLAVISEIASPGLLEDVDEESAGSTAFYYLLGFSVFFFYYSMMESVFGRTVGKFITGTHVVDQQGRLPNASSIMLRSLSRFVPFEAFSFLGSPRGWHDSWTDTWVVDMN